MPVVTIGYVRNAWRGGLGSSMGKNSAKPAKTKNVTPAVTPWGKNRVKNTETGKHVLIMPGIGYTVDRPLLYWAAQALAADGWFVDRLDLKLTEDVEFPEMIACMERVVDHGGPRRLNMLQNPVRKHGCWLSPSHCPRFPTRIRRSWACVWCCSLRY